MKRSKEISIGIVAQVAAVVLLTGCDHDQRALNPADYKRCVDEWGKVVESRYCDQAYARGMSGGTAPGGYFWYYGGNGYAPGTYVGGGSRNPSEAFTTTPRPSAPSSSVTATPRGGFGASAPSSSSGSVSASPRGGFGGSFGGGASSGG